MDMIGRIRRLHSRGRKSVREIARLTGLSRNTIAKWLEAPVKRRRSTAGLRCRPSCCRSERC
jgi:DNA invertase Pin-like site-specific DNA recombinase